MSSKFPIGVAIIKIPLSVLSIIPLFIIISSCTPVHLSKQDKQLINKDVEIKEDTISINKDDLYNQKDNITEKKIEKNNNALPLIKEITLLLHSKNKENISNQFINVLELAIYNKSLEDIFFEIKYFDNEAELKKIINTSKKEGKIFIGPIESGYTKVVKEFCKNQMIFFSFSSDTSLAGECIFLLNFFPKNELEQLLNSLPKESKIAVLYPENNYGYMINVLIDDAVNKSDSILVNRASYKNDLSNVRDSIKELGKYELRKYELNRQKQLLLIKDDDQSRKRLKKLEKFKTTSDYDFTHILIADYGLNLLQVAPLLPYYDIDPNVVQFIATGVIDDEVFFLEPSLQGAIFPGIEKYKRIDLLNQYREIYEENLLRISTLPYDLVGLLNYIYSKQLDYNQFLDLLNNSTVKFDGVDGEFYFKDNMIERKLDILKILNGNAKKIN